MQLHHLHNPQKTGIGSSMEKIIGAFEARRNLGKLIEEAFYRKDSFIIERSGRAMAAIISIEEYEKLRQLARTHVFAFLQKSWEHNKDVPEKDLERDIEQAMTSAKKGQAGAKPTQNDKK